MSVFQEALDSLDAAFRNPKKKLLKMLGLYKAPSDYYNAQKDKCEYWQKSRLVVWIGEENYHALFDAVCEWGPTLAEAGIYLSLSRGTSERLKADVVVEMGDTVKTGGVTHTTNPPNDPRVIVWAFVTIARSEKGKRLKQIALHELGHAWGLTHDGANDDDVMHSPVFSSSLSKADRGTLLKVYANRPKGG